MKNIISLWEIDQELNLIREEARMLDVEYHKAIMPQMCWYLERRIDILREQEVELDITKIKYEDK